MFVGPVISTRDPLKSTVHRLFCKSRGSGSRAQCMRPIDKRDGTLLSIKKKKIENEDAKTQPLSLISTIK